MTGLVIRSGSRAALARRVRAATAGLDIASLVNNVLVTGTTQRCAVRRQEPGRRAGSAGGCACTYGRPGDPVGFIAAAPLVRGCSRHDQDRAADARGPDPRGYSFYACHRDGDGLHSSKQAGLDMTCATLRVAGLLAWMAGLA